MQTYEVNLAFSEENVLDSIEAFDSYYLGGLNCNQSVCDYLFNGMVVEPEVYQTVWNLADIEDVEFIDDKEVPIADSFQDDLDGLQTFLDDLSLYSEGIEITKGQCQDNLNQARDGLEKFNNGFSEKNPQEALYGLATMVDFLVSLCDRIIPHLEKSLLSEQLTNIKTLRATYLELKHKPEWLVYSSVLDFLLPAIERLRKEMGRWNITHFTVTKVKILNERSNTFIFFTKPAI